MLSYDSDDEEADMLLPCDEDAEVKYAASLKVLAELSADVRICQTLHGYRLSLSSLVLRRSPARSSTPTPAQPLSRDEAIDLARRRVSLRSEQRIARIVADAHRKAEEWAPLAAATSAAFEAQLKDLEIALDGVETPVDTALRLEGEEAVALRAAKKEKKTRLLLEDRIASLTAERKALDATKKALDRELVTLSHEKQHAQRAPTSASDTCAADVAVASMFSAVEPLMARVMETLADAVALLAERRAGDNKLAQVNAMYARLGEPSPLAPLGSPLTTMQTRKAPPKAHKMNFSLIEQPDANADTEEQTSHRVNINSIESTVDVGSVTSRIDSVALNQMYVQSIYDRPDVHSHVTQYLMLGTREETHLIKYSKFGKPHARKFWVSADRTFICWCDPEKAALLGAPGEVPIVSSEEAKRKVSEKEMRALSLQHLQRIELGRGTVAFAKCRVQPCTDEFNWSFSLIFGGSDARSLDLQATDQSEFEAWLLCVSHISGIGISFVNPLQAPSILTELTALGLHPMLQKICTAYHVLPTVMKKIYEDVLERRDEVVRCFKLFNGNVERVYLAVGGIHPPALSRHDALWMTKGELHFISRLDIFRTSKVWAGLVQMRLIFDKAAAS